MHRGEHFLDLSNAPMTVPCARPIRSLAIYGSRSTESFLGQRCSRITGLEDPWSIAKPGVNKFCNLQITTGTTGREMRAQAQEREAAETRLRGLVRPRPGRRRVLTPPTLRRRQGRRLDLLHLLVPRHPQLPPSLLRLLAQNPRGSLLTTTKGIPSSKDGTSSRAMTQHMASWTSSMKGPLEVMASQRQTLQETRL